MKTWPEVRTADNVPPRKFICSIYIYKEATQRIPRISSSFLSRFDESYYLGIIHEPRCNLFAIMQISMVTVERLIS